MSLLHDDNVQSEEIINTEDNNVSEASADTAPSWWIDEKTPGTGNRPDFLPEKYKTVADVVKAHKELEQRLGSAPAEYDFSKGESWIEPEYEPFHEMAEFAKSKHVPQEVMDKMLETVGMYLDEFKTDLNEEKLKLGERASERLGILNNWARANLSEKAYLSLSAGMRTADAIEALEEIRSKMESGNTMIPNSNASLAQGGMTIEEYRSELQSNYSKFKSDPAYRKQMEGKLESIVGRK